MKWKIGDIVSYAKNWRDSGTIVEIDLTLLHIKWHLDEFEEDWHTQDDEKLTLLNGLELLKTRHKFLTKSKKNSKLVSKEEKTMNYTELKDFEQGLVKDGRVFVRITDGGLFIAGTGIITRVGTKSVRVKLDEPVSGHDSVRAPLFTSNSSWSINNGVFPLSDGWGASAQYGITGNGVGGTAIPAQTLTSPTYG